MGRSQSKAEEPKVTAKAAEISSEGLESLFAPKGELKSDWGDTTPKNSSALEWTTPFGEKTPTS